MNVKKAVKISFIFIILLIFGIFLINSLILYQIKENNQTKKSVDRLVKMQDNMNTLVKELLTSTKKKQLENIANNFINFEKSFEKELDKLLQIEKKDLVDYLIKDIHEYEQVKKNLNLISKSEKEIEELFENIFYIQSKKIELKEKFDLIYPKENRLRNIIETIILKTKDLDIVRDYGDMQYYSKEALFQHKNSEYLNKWLNHIDLIQKEFKNKEVFNRYRNTSKKIGTYAIDIKKYEIKELELQNDIYEIVNKNKDISIKIQKDIDRLSQNFIDDFYFAVILILIFTVLFILYLSYKVNKNVGLSFDQVQKQVDKGLKKIKNLNKEIENTQKEVVFTMGSIGESRSKETGNHVKRVAEYSKVLAQHYGLPKKEVELLKQASPMHDIGKVAIADSILNKPGRFNEEEREIMNTHAQLGYDMLKHSNRPLLKAAAIVSYEHHEKWDGTGYPNKLKGEDIHIYGRITALADVFDALGSDRCYKKAWEDERIFNLFKEEKGKHFDPKLVDIFFENLDKFLEIREKFKDS
ncbi:MAG: HD-GYP domain-containing protein [Campylobacterota bacterium]